MENVNPEHKGEECRIPAISVIIPSYKPGAYITECLDSLCEQTLDHGDFEVIIVLNGCRVPWYDHISDYISDHANTAIRLIQTDEGGVSNARNIGIDAAKGEYIAFLDDDDYVSPRYLEQLLSISSKECVGLSDAVYFEDVSGELNFDNVHHCDYLKNKDSEAPSMYASRRFFNGPVMKLIHRSIIGDSRFDRRFSNGEDSLFMALISRKIATVRFCKTDAVYYRRVRENSATTRHRSTSAILRNCLMAIGQYTKYWLRHPLEYNAPFMLSRILASVKNFVYASPLHKSTT